MTHPIVSRYPFGPGPRVRLFSGLLDSDAFGRSSGVIELELEPVVDVSFRVKGTGLAALGECTVRLARRGAGRVELDAYVTASNTSGALSGSLRGEGELGGTGPLGQVIIHWLNLPHILPAAPLSEAGRHWAGRWHCSSAGWDLTLDARPDLQSVLAGLRGTHRSDLTHTALLRRSDGSTFTSAEARNVLYGVQMAFSCAVGRWVAPALPVGLDADGRRVWEQWVPWRCDPLRGQMGWLDTHKADDLRSFVSAFIEHWCDPARTDVVRYFTHHLLAANNPSVTVEGRIMMVQAGVEYLGWVSNVLTGAVPKADYENSKKWPASRKLRTLLTEAGIAPNLPSGYPALDTLSKQKSFHGDGPATLVKVRNMLVHPKDANEPYRIGQLVAEAWHLSMQWGNLLLLARLGYRGSYQPWTFAGTTAHTSELVPWACESRAGDVPP